MAAFREELAWAGGLFEGEGCIGLYRRKGRRLPEPRLRIAMTDEDILQRFAKAIGFGNVLGPYHFPSMPAHYKPRFVWQVTGFHLTQAVLAMMWPWLGDRRKATAREVLTAR